jgi:transcription antitermination factor NusG
VAWLVAQTESQREQVAVKWLKHQRFGVYLPCIRTQAIIHQRVVVRLAPLFPSYVFIGAVEHWQPIVRTVGVIDVLFSGDHPARLDDDVIDTIRAQERDGMVQLPPLRRGDRVRVIRGALQGQLAIFQGMKPKKRCELLLHILGAERHIKMKRRDIRRLNGLA